MTAAARSALAAAVKGPWHECHLVLHDSGWLLVVLPWLLGVFAGTPLLTRDFETRSYRFSSVQGVSLRRQVAVKLAVFGVLVVVASVLLGLLGSWATDPLRQFGLASRWQPEYFSITVLIALQHSGLLPAGLVKPAKFVKVLLTPSDLPDRSGSLEVSSWFTGPHGRLSPIAAQAMLGRIPRHVPFHVAELRSWLAARGIRYWIGEQPASRYWLFQAIVAVILLALAMLLACVAVWASRPERDHLHFRGRRLAAWP